MISINMRIFKMVLLLVAVCNDQVTESIPLSNETSIEDSSTPTTLHQNLVADHHDQRQNGTENYRIHVDGLVFVVAPAETLLLASTAGGDIPNLMNDNSVQPPPNKPEIESKPSSTSKSTNRIALRMANFLVPLLRRMQHN